MQAKRLCILVYIGVYWCPFGHYDDALVQSLTCSGDLCVVRHDTDWTRRLQIRIEHLTEDCRKVAQDRRDLNNRL